MEQSELERISLMLNAKLSDCRLDDIMASRMDDELITKLMALNNNLIVSIQIQPMEQAAWMILPGSWASMLGSSTR